MESLLTAHTYDIIDNSECVDCIFVDLNMCKPQADTPLFHIPYSQKFSPGEIFRFFHLGASWVKIFSVNYFAQ